MKESVQRPLFHIPFVCPLCHGPLAKVGNSLCCEKRHTYDMAKQGYVNLLLKKPDTLYEDRALFEARRNVYRAGFFDPLLEALRAEAPYGALLDAGCGEGSLLGALMESAEKACGLDIAKPAILMAAKAFRNIAWCVGDLCNIPLGNASVDTVLNILTPANYQEFLRVLKPGGRLLKVMPGPDHLLEIRMAAGKPAYAHEREDTLRAFAKRFSFTMEKPIRYTVPVSGALCADVFRMTPLTQRIPLPQALPTAVTVDVTLLAGTPH